MESELQTIFPRCASLDLDVHRETVEATVRLLEGERVLQQTQRWGAVIADIEAMAEVANRQKVTQVGMESTGVLSTTSWRPASRDPCECPASETSAWS